MKKHGCREEIEHIMAQQNRFWLKFSHGKTTYPITYYKGSPVNINETTSPLYMLKIYLENLRTWPNPSFHNIIEAVHAVSSRLLAQLKPECSFGTYKRGSHQNPSPYVLIFNYFP